MRRERGILGTRAVIDLPDDGDREVRARELEEMGLVKVREESYVRCVHWADGDVVDAWDRTCTGRVAIIEEEFGSWDETRVPWDSVGVYGEARCPRCDRDLDVRRKTRFTSLVVRRNDDAVRALVRNRIEALGFGCRERPKGLFIIESEVRDVRLYVVDLCPERAATAPRDQAVLFVRCDEHLLLPRLPDVPTFALEDLARGDVAAFEETLRAMACAPERYSLLPAAAPPRAAPARPSAVTRDAPGAGRV